VRLYRSGDRVRAREDGVLEFLGRIDRQVKIRGFRVEPAEVESVLRRHPGVRDAAVIVRGGRLVAYVIGGADERSLRAHARAFLLDAMVPSAFIAMDELPRTANGKLNREALPAEAVDPRDVRVPRTPIEELLAGIWREVLGVARVGIDDDFFALGGHSLLATQAISRVRAALGISVPLRQLFETPTVARFAEAVADRERDPLPPIERVDGDSAPLSLAQMRIWFIEQVTRGRAPWTIPFAARLRGPLDRARLDRALEQLVRRHEALRTRLVEGDRGAMQRIEDAVSLETSLLRVRVQRLAADEHELHLAIHHIICDGWSIGVLLRDLSALYAGRELAPNPIRYIDYAAWQRRQVEAGALDADVAWWRERLAGASNEPLVAHDHDERGEVTHRGARHRAVIPDDVTTGLRALARAEGATLFMMLLTAYAVLLSRHSARTDLTIGTDVANRRHGATEDIVGFFVNLLALRVDASGDPSFPELLRRVRAICLDAYAHQEAPFERVAAAVGGDRDPARNPLFRTLLVLQNTPLPLSLGDVAVEPIEVDSGTTPLELMVSVREEGGALVCIWSYRSDLYRPATIEGLAAQFDTLLRAIAADPTRPISELPLFDEAALGFEAGSLSRAEQEALLLAMRGIE
jgi:acyl carrier protein